MSLEFELQKYPKDIKLKDGSKSKLRPLRKDDEKAFHEFFSAVPEAERMFIKHRVTEPEVIHEWCQKIDLGRNLPLLACRDGRIVGDATLHQLRHAFATEVYRASRDLRLTQELMGHAHPNTTAIYAAYSPGDAAGVVEGLGPWAAERQGRGDTRASRVSTDVDTPSRVSPRGDRR